MDPTQPSNGQPPTTPLPQQSSPATPAPTPQTPVVQNAGTSEQLIATSDQSPPPAASPANGPKPPVSKKLLLIGGVVVLIIIVGLILAGVSRNKNIDSTRVVVSETPTPKKEVKATPKPEDKHSPSQIMLYGTWTEQKSVIKAVNLKTLESFPVATLPLAVKKVSVLSAQNLLFIDQIDTTDRGKRITVLNIKDKLAKLSIPAASGYLIDTYVLSPDKKYIALWEVQPASNTKTLKGGKSRIYAVDLSRPTVKNLLYDERSSLTQPLHYPRAILNDGTVFADTVMPNDPQTVAAEWAYGMSVVDFDGTNKRDIETMKAGTYGSRPTLSPDGKYLLFAGYNGTNGDGKTVTNGYRQAILTPNTVDLLNTQTLKRFTLPNFPSTSIYSNVAWETESGNVIATSHANGSSTNEVYTYDLVKQTPNKIELPSNVTDYVYLSQLSQTRALIGTQDTRPSNLGNLGDDYAFAFTQMAIWDKSDGKVAFFPLQDTFAQYITLLPMTYFKTVLGK